MGSKRPRNAPAQQVLRGEEGKDSIFNEKGNVQQLGEGIQSQELNDDAINDYIFNEHRAPAIAAEEQTAEESAYIEKEPTEMMIEVVLKKEKIVKTNRALTTALTASIELLEKNTAE